MGVRKVLMRKSRSNIEGESGSGETNNDTIARLVVKTIGQGRKPADRKKEKGGLRSPAFDEAMRRGLYTSNLWASRVGRVKMESKGGCGLAATMERDGGVQKEEQSY
jgi:hypothetical protein